VTFVFELSDLWPDSIVAVGAMKRNIALRGLEKVELFLYSRAAAVVALTGAFKENLTRRGISSEKIAVVTNGVDLSRYKPRPKDHALAAEWGIGPDDFVIGYIGTHGMAHALDNVLDTAGLLANTNIRFLLIGAGAERERLVMEAQRRALKNVIFVPPQEKSTIPRFWSICNAALVHLKADPLFKTVIPSKIFEAMGMGLPIILASPEGEASRIVTREGIGVWVPPQDPDALSQAVLLLSQNRELLARFAEASGLAAPRHSRERQAKDMLSVLESVSFASEKIAT